MLNQSFRDSHFLLGVFGSVDLLLVLTTDTVEVTYGFDYTPTIQTKRPYLSLRCAHLPASLCCLNISSFNSRASSAPSFEQSKRFT